MLSASLPLFNFNQRYHLQGKNKKLLHDFVVKKRLHLLLLFCASFNQHFWVDPSENPEDLLT